MVKTARSRVKTLTINRSRDIVVDRLVHQCEVGDHSRCTGWAVLKKEHSPINANFFLRCTCACHKKGSQLRKRKVVHKAVRKRKKQVKRRKTSKKVKKTKRKR